MSTDPGEHQGPQGASGDASGGTSHDPGTSASTSAKATPPASRAPVRARGTVVDPNDSPTVEPGAPDPAEPEHTPTLPAGAVITDPAMAQGVAATLGGPNATPLQPATAEAAEKLAKARESGEAAVTIEVAAPAPGAAMGPVTGGRMEVAGPAPLPRPSDPNLTAGTVHAFEPEGSDGEQEPG